MVVFVCPSAHAAHSYVCVVRAFCVGAGSKTFAGILQNEGRTCNKFVGQISDVLTGLEKLHEKAWGTKKVKPEI